MTTNVFTYKDLGELKAVVEPDSCDGCAFCLDVCPFNAITLVTLGVTEEGYIDRRIVIDDKLCQGCGLCQGTCPKEGVHVQGHSMKELSLVISELLSQ